MQPFPKTRPQLNRDIGSSIFGANIAGYAAARLGYPQEMFDAIARRCGQTGSVLEIGPGTGLATLDIIRTLAPAIYLGVEPDPHLAEHLAGELGHAAPEPTTRIIQSRFEDLETDEQFDLACCAAAFHWLNPEQAFGKLRQVLRPGATLAIWWNCYRQTGIGDAFADRVEPLLENIQLAPSQRAAGHYSLDHEFHRSALSENRFTGFEQHLFRRDRILTTEQVVTLYSSYSYIRALPVAERYELLARIAELSESVFNGIVPNITLTALYLASSPSSI